MTSFSRKLVSENKFTTNDVIWPVFLVENDRPKSQIKTMPNVSVFEGKTKHAASL